jgi:hypothetical protein
MKAQFYIFFLCIFLGMQQIMVAQPNFYEQKGEIGFSLGASHYFGDLNTRTYLNKPHLAVSAFFRKNFNNYIAARVNASFLTLGYSDKYSKNTFQRLRNLNFNSNVFEIALQGDFNFYRFEPTSELYRFTPYVTLGVGIFTYDPYTFLDGEKYFLRPLNTEGQGQPTRPKAYGSTAFCMPFGVGIKYAITPKMNIGFELAHRFTTTDYLDDVSRTYAGPAAFVDPSSPPGAFNPALLLQDRSYELTSTPIGIKDRQRGYSKQRDQYITAQIMLSFNLTSYKCPPL